MTTAPTREFVKMTLDMSQEFLGDSRALPDQGRYRSAVDRAYYSVHYAAVDVLTESGVRPARSHRGPVNQFGLEIVNRGAMESEYGKILSDAMARRTLSTYSTEADITSEDARVAVADADKVPAAVRSILKL